MIKVTDVVEVNTVAFGVVMGVVMVDGEPIEGLTLIARNGDPIDWMHVRTEDITKVNGQSVKASKRDVFKARLVEEWASNEPKSDKLSQKMAAHLMEFINTALDEGEDLSALFVALVDGKCRLDEAARLMMRTFDPDEL